VSELLCVKQARSANHITRYVSRLSNWFLSTNVFCLSARNSEKRIAKRVGYVQQTPARLGTPDCPVVHQTVSGAPGWFA
jgi:hypothetical protein